MKQGSAPSIFPSISLQEQNAENDMSYEMSFEMTEADVEQSNNSMEYEQSIPVIDTIFEENIVEDQSTEIQELQPSGSIEQAFVM